MARCRIPSDLKTGIGDCSVILAAAWGVSKATWYLVVRGNFQFSVAGPQKRIPIIYNNEASILNDTFQGFSQ